MTSERGHGDLTGKAVLVVEDEYFLAKETADAVRRAGGQVLGPIPDVRGALAIVREAEIDAAVLDIRLGDELSFPMAEALREKGVNVVFTSGYEDWFLPNAFKGVPVHRKPIDPDNVVRFLIEAEPDTAA